MADVNERFNLSEEALDELYGWMDAIPLPPVKNIARDFSDGVLVAKTVAHFLPKMVDGHNYLTANTAELKRINWNSLNNCVFCKMGIRMSDSTIQQLIDAKAGALEQVLWHLRRKIQEPHTSATTQQSFGQSPPSRDSTLGSYSHNSQPQSVGYVVPPSIIGGEETSNNNPASGGPPAQIIYQGHKMIPLAFLEEKDRYIKSIEYVNNESIVKIYRLETKVKEKNQRIEDLAFEILTLKTIYDHEEQKA